MKVKTVNITPDKSLMPKLGYTGYTLPQAIAEFIDNSIDASKSISGKNSEWDQEKPEDLKIFIQIKKNYISIKDNSIGMTEQQLIDAMTLARSNKKDQIGRFGLGMKTASLSLGSKFTIITKSSNDVLYSTSYNELQWLRAKDYEWSIDIKTREVDDKSTYTKIKIEKLKQPYLRYVDKLRDDISIRYAPFLRSKTVIIKVNSKNCRSSRKKLIKGSKKEINTSLMDYGDLLVGFNREDRIHGWYGLIENVVGGSYYGFTLYWKGRMISYYDKIGIDEIVANARIVGELHLDFLDVTHNKREFIKESDQYRAVERILTDKFRDLVLAARTLADDQAIQLALNDQTNEWLRKLTEAFIKSKQLKDLSLLSGLEGEIEKANSKTTGSEKSLVEVEKRDNKLIDSLEEDMKQSKESDDSTNDDDDNKGLNRKERNKCKPKKRKLSNNHTIKVKGKRFVFSHKYVTLGKEAASKSYDVEKRLGIINIYTNVDFPAFKVTNDKPFYSVMLIANVLAEVFVQRFGLKEYTVDEIGELILRETCQIDVEKD